MNKTQRIGFQVVGQLVLALLLVGAASAQFVGPFSSFPSEDETDGRFLAAVAGFEGLTAERTVLGISVPDDRFEFTFRIFDGDTAEPCVFDNLTCFQPSRGHWDEPLVGGPNQLVVNLYEDPLRAGDPSMLGAPVGTWLGNDDGMPDNGWWSLTIPVPSDSGARAPSGSAFFLVEIGLENSNSAVSDYKVQANVPLSVFSASFGFEAGQGGSFNDLAILYPDVIPVYQAAAAGCGADGCEGSEIEPLQIASRAFPWQEHLATSGYDGTYRFFLDVPVDTETLTIWDGDFDYGTQNDAAGNALPTLFGRLPLATCRDTDDANTPDVYPFATAPDVNPEGAVTGLNIQSPADDNRLDFLLRSPCVTYTVIDPFGNEYLNANPSSNREWERFVISTTESDADYLVGDAAVLPHGSWEVRVEGLDISNSNFWKFEYAACGLVGGAPLCPDEAVEVGDTVFLDENGNGFQDGSEPGIPGCKVDLLGDGSTVTGDGGLYALDVDPGSEAQPASYTVEVAPECLGEVPTGAVGDRVWLDVDGSAFDEGEPGIANVLIRLRECSAGLGRVLGTTRTDGEGYYLFADLPAGTYCTEVVDATLPAGLVLTGGTDPSSSRTITSTEIFRDLDFGYAPYDPAAATAAIGDTVWMDYDNNGVRDEGEAGIGGVTLEIATCAVPGPATVVATTTTDANGGYLFSSLADGCYDVFVTDVNGVLAGLALTTDASATGPTRQIQVSGGDVYLAADFGYRSDDLYCIADVTWFDADHDGLYEPAPLGEDAPIAGVTVRLTDGKGGTMATAASGADGSFSFCGLRGDDPLTAQIEAGAYIIDITDVSAELAGLVGTTQPALDEELLVLVTDVDVVGVNFGYFSEGFLADCLWTTPTSITGEIEWVDGVPQNNYDFDFGCQPQGSIGDFIWLDLDGDGEQDGGEPGLGGVTVELRDCSGQPLTSLVTSDGTVDVDSDGSIDPLGFYRFAGLAPGCYRVVVDPTTLPVGVAQSYDLDGQLDDETELTLGISEDRDDADFGYAPFGSIGDRVWLDFDGDGVQDAGEPGLSGVRVELRDCSDRLLDSAVTSNGFEDVDGDGMIDAPGYYLFSDLGPGCYQVVVVRTTLPAGARQTFDLDGLLDDRTAVELGGGEDRDDVDFGYRVFGDGAGTPGFWKNHAEAWPVHEIYLGGVLYTKAEGIAILQQSTSGDMTYVLAAHLIAAKLNVFRATESSCITSCIEQADAWLVDHPIGSNVDAKSRAWKEIEPVKNKLDRYNNGRLCAPSRG